MAVFAAAGGYAAWRSFAAVIPTNPPTTRTLYGLHQDLTYFGGDPFWSDRINILKSVNGEVSRNSFLWSNIEASQGVKNWANYDTIVSRLKSIGAKPIFVLYGSPTWANGSGDQLVVPGNGSANDPAFQAWVASYASFASQAAQRYKGQAAGWELWNEPNENYFWKPAPSIPQYEYWYRQIYSAMKTADPSANLAVGGLTGLYASCCTLGSTFLSQLIDDNAQITSVGIHPYDNDAPDIDTAFQPNFTDIGRIRSLLDSKGQQAVDIWVTEWGWNGTDPASEQTQAVYLKKSLEMLRDQYPYVTYATYFVDVDTNGTYSQGLYRSDAVTAKPAAQVFKDFMASLPPAVSLSVVPSGSSPGSSGPVSKNTNSKFTSPASQPVSTVNGGTTDNAAKTKLTGSNPAAGQKASAALAPAHKTNKLWLIAAAAVVISSGAATLYYLRLRRPPAVVPAASIITPTTELKDSTQGNVIAPKQKD